MPDEFNLIEKYFAPLAAPEGLSLLDDAACVPSRSDYDQIFTKDVLVAGKHFFPDDNPKDLAFKAVSVNVSDLAAKGAEPAFYMLGLSLPSSVSEQWISEFSQGLAEAQEFYNIGLLGGDSTSTHGPVTVSVTAIGYVPKGMMIKRSGAEIGDLVYVTGTLGDAACALQGLLGNCEPVDDLLPAYYRPEARYNIGMELRDIATSAADISDGLLADAGHIAKASSLGISIFLDKIPVSLSVQNLVKANSNLCNQVWCGGDDYELIFTASENKFSEIEALANENAIKITEIGKVTNGLGVELIDNIGKKVQVTHKGYQHFR